MKTNIRQAVVLAIMAASLASAHHSAAPFDTSIEKALTGTVKQVDWTNPHTWIWVDVPNDKGGVDTWGIEGMSPNFLDRRGWTRNTIKAGEKVTFSVRPMRDGSKAGMFVSAKLPDGRLVRMSGQPIDP